MIFLSLIILLIATILDILITTYIYKDRETPKAYVLLHGLLSIAAIALLGLYTYKHLNYTLVVILLVFSSLIGAIIAYKDFFGLNRSKLLVIIHIIFAVAAFALLIYFYYIKG